jgi:integrase
MSPFTARNQQYESHEMRFIADHIAEWAQVMAAKGTGAQHRKQFETYVRDFAKTIPSHKPDPTAPPNTPQFTGEPRLSDIMPSVLYLYVNKGKLAGDSTASQVMRMRAVKAFCRWLCDNYRMPEDPLRGVKVQVVKKHHQVYKRRPLTIEQFEKLIDTTHKSPKTREGLTGPERAVMYELAAYSGQRRGTLLHMLHTDFDVIDGVPVLRTNPSWHKSEKEILIPMRSEFLPRLNGFLASRPQGQPIFGARPRMKTARMIQQDLADAGLISITKRIVNHTLLVEQAPDSRGFIVDFHSLRGTCATLLARAGVPMKVVQEILGHSDINLTANIYTSVALGDKVKAVESIKNQGTAQGADSYTGHADHVNRLKVSGPVRKPLETVLEQLILLNETELVKVRRKVRTLLGRGGSGLRGRKLNQQEGNADEL